jgi:hypothetical protein
MWFDVGICPIRPVCRPTGSTVATVSAPRAVAAVELPKPAPVDLPQADPPRTDILPKIPALPPPPPLPNIAGILGGIRLPF